MVFDVSRIWTNFARWQYFAALIVIFCSGLLDIVVDFKEAFDEFDNFTMTTFWPQKARTISRFPSYVLNFVLIIFTLGWILRTYSNLAKESDKIKQRFTGNINDIETGIAEIKTALMKKKYWKENQARKTANILANIYVGCCIIWSFCYAYEVIKVHHKITIGAILNCLAHFLSYGSLVSIMWLTNKIIDQMKETALQKMIFEHQNTTVDLESFKMFIERYNPYALLFAKKTNLPSIATTILPGLVSLILSIIKSRFNW